MKAPSFPCAPSTAPMTTPTQTFAAKMPIVPATEVARYVANTLQIRGFAFTTGFSNTSFTTIAGDRDMAVSPFLG